MKPAPERNWDWLSFALYLILIWIATIRLTDTGWIPDLEHVQFLATFGVILGVLLGISHFKPRSILLLSIAYSLILIPWQLTLTLDPRFTWLERLANLGERLSLMLFKLFASEPVDDPIFFLTTMCLLFWIFAVSGGYLLTRRQNSWGAILPPGIALLIIQHYNSTLANGWRSVIYFALVSLILAGRTMYLKMRKQWKQKLVHIPAETGAEISWAIVVTALILIIGVSLLPAINEPFLPAQAFYQRLAEPLENTRENLKDALAALVQDSPAVRNKFDENLPLGTGAELGDTILFSVQPFGDPITSGRYYWRTRSFNLYDEGTWRTNILTAQNFTPDDMEINLPPWFGRKNQDFEFLIWEPISGNLPVAGAPMFASIPVQAVLEYDPEGSVDPILFHINDRLEKGRIYQISSAVPQPTVFQLRQASSRYPEWIRNRYQILPSNISDEIIQLAFDITRNAATPYDKAVAVTRWLRENITYQSVIPAPPPGKDPLEWFLFESRVGFCNYYATAEVVLLRIVGVPARLAVGYALGEYDSSTNEYLVRERDSHAWPEVYFNGFGWVEFEPTVSQPGIQRQESASSDTDPSSNPFVARPTPVEEDFRIPTPNPDRPTPIDAPFNYQNVFRWVGIFFIILAIFITYTQYSRFVDGLSLPVALLYRYNQHNKQPPKWLQQWANKFPQTHLQVAFQKLNRAFRLVGLPQDDSLTPAEKASRLAEALPTLRDPVQSLVIEYQMGSYSPYPCNPKTARLAGDTILRLAMRHRIRRFFNRVV